MSSEDTGGAVLGEEARQVILDWLGADVPQFAADCEPEADDIICRLAPHVTALVAQAVAEERERIARDLLAVDGVEWALAGQHAGVEAARIARGAS